MDQPVVQQIYAEPPIITAAKWLGGSLVVASLVLVVGFSMIFSRPVHQAGDAAEAARRQLERPTSNVITLQTLRNTPIEFKEVK